MTSSRAQALTAALQDLARDLAADLGKAARYRGYNGSSHSLTVHRDPGDSLEVFAAQKAEHTPPLRDVFASYSTTANAYAEGIGSLSPDDRAAILELRDAIQSVTNHDEATALVATF